MTLKSRMVVLGRKHLSPATKRRLKRVYYALRRRRAGSRSRSVLPGASAAYGVGRYDEARAKVDRVLATNPHDPAGLELASKIAIQQGRFTDAGLHATIRAERSRDPGHWSHARKIIGRVRETDARWRPRLAADYGVATPGVARASDGGSPGSGSASTPGPTRNGTVIYLAKESRPYLHNGFCTRSHETLQSLAQAGRSVLGVTLPGFPGLLGISNAEPESRVEQVRYRHLLPNAGTASRALAHDEYLELASRLLAAEVRRERPSLLHVASGHRGFESALTGAAVAERFGIPWLYEVRSFFETTWTPDTRYAEAGEYYERRFATETRMMHAADLVVTLSGPMRDEIIEARQVDPSKVRVIPNAVDVNRFTPRERDPQLRQHLGLGDSFTLGYVSNLSHPREGQQVLIEAVARLRKQGRNVTGLLVGEGKRQQELEKLAAKLGVGRQITFTGSVPFDEVADYYAQIDVFVVPRVDDRAARMVSPMKPFEAMAMRVPLLVADLPALAEIVAAGRGRTFEVGDPESLATEAGTLQDDPELRARLVEEAAGWVATERTWSSVAESFSAIYTELGAGRC